MARDVMRGLIEHVDQACKIADSHSFVQRHADWVGDIFLKTHALNVSFCYTVHQHVHQQHLLGVGFGEMLVQVKRTSCGVLQLKYQYSPPAAHWSQ